MEKKNNYFYLDYNATANMHPDVIEAMTNALVHYYGNASSPHQLGREALIQVLEGKVPETLQKKPEAEKDEIDGKEEPSSQSGNDASGSQTQSPVT